MVFGEVHRLGLYGGMEEPMHQVDSFPDLMEETHIFYSEDWVGVSKPTGGDLSRFGIS